MKATKQNELDRYATRSLKRSERLYGAGFQSPGGEEGVKSVLTDVPVLDTWHVLDAGCGTGGAAIYLHQVYGCKVLGIDASISCIEMAKARVPSDAVDSIEFKVGDISASTTLSVHEKFNMVWSRDTLVLLEEKDAMLKNFFNTIQPEGFFVISDFCRGAVVSEQFKTHAKACAYHLDSLATYGERLASTGFEEILVLDRSAELAAWLRFEIKRLQDTSSIFVAEFGAGDFDRMLARWRAKLQFCEEGSLVWGHIRARTRLPTLVTQHSR